MENKYLFIKNTQSTLDLAEFTEFTDIHIWNYVEIINYSTTQNIHVYAKDMNELQKILNDGFIPHICFIGDSIFSSFYDDSLLYNDIERFWFPSLKNISNDTLNFLSLKNIEHTPIAISFNEHIQIDINYEQFLPFIENINQSYINPLFKKDLELQNNEIFSDNNIAIINNEKYYVVLGLFGDYFSKEKLTNLQLFSGIMRDKNCVKCEFADLCKNRGLGFIKHHNKIQSCIGIKLFQQN
jgi:hypothetical protein